MKTWIAIFCGGGLGALTRYVVGQATAFFLVTTFPLATLLINLTGCLLYGIAGAMLKSHHPNWLSALILIGFLGGYTTFSTYMADNVGLLELNQLAFMWLNLAGQVIMGFGAFILGRWLVT